jgi:putative nucleotidyltransferase with HDIG domain
MVLRWLAEGSFDEWLPEVAALRGVQQPEEYHGEGDAFVHTLLAIAAVADEEDPRVFWGALLHDIGKSEKTFFDGSRWRSVGHAEAGAQLVPGIMARLDWPAMWRGWSGITCFIFPGI